MESARILIEVTAGMIPGQVMDELTEKWAITSKEWEASDGLRTFLSRLALANAYALKLEIDSISGRAPNWVRIDYVWL